MHAGSTLPRMLVRFGADALGAEWPACVVCVGTFDGVHLGHQRVISAAVEAARKAELPAVVLTFDRHPMAVLAPDRCPPAVGTLGVDLDQFRNLGVAAVVVLRFDAALANTSAEEFFEAILVQRLRAEQVVVGHDFAFGKGRAGTPDWLESRIPTSTVPPFQIDGERVSSSRIRQAIADGNVETATRLLGRPWILEGIVVSGQKLGRTLGFPTVNLAQAGPQVLPRDGVYAGRAEAPDGRYGAAIGVGVRPTVGGGPRTIEAFLLDYSGEDLYGAPIQLSFCQRLRDEAKFDSVEALKAQMELDVQRTKSLLSL